MSAEIIMGVVAILLMRAKVFYASKFCIVEEGGSGDSIKLHMYLLTYSRIRINDYGFLLKKASSVESKEFKKKSNLALGLFYTDLALFILYGYLFEYTGK